MAKKKSAKKAKKAAKKSRKKSRASTPVNIAGPQYSPWAWPKG
jgi:hypothetical protein